MWTRSGDTVQAKARPGQSPHRSLPAALEPLLNFRQLPCHAMPHRLFLAKLARPHRRVLRAELTLVALAPPPVDRKPWGKTVLLKSFPMFVPSLPW